MHLCATQDVIVECISKDCAVGVNAIDEADEPAFVQYKACSEVR